jgi:hypothetical protein
VWAIRAVEVLVALILAKFAIVAVLGLGGAALNHLPAGGVAAGLAGAVLVILGAFAPWVLLRLLPMAELAHGAAGALRPQLSETISDRFKATRHEGVASGWAEKAGDWATGVIASMRRDADGVERSHGPDNDAAADAARLRALERGVGARANGAGAGGREGVETSDDPVHAGNGAGPQGSASAVASGSAPAEPASTERLPGMGPIWQAPDWSWQPLVLGLEEDSGGPPIEPPLPEPQPVDTVEDSPAPRRPPRHPHPPRRETGDAASSGEQHDPLPESQEPNDGRL